jgi:putative addiction module killer protein/probable addiction module antidote protein
MLDGIKDAVAYAAIQARTDRLTRGLFGDCAPVGHGVWELRIDVGPGYRIYYARSGKQVILCYVPATSVARRKTSRWRRNIGAIMKRGHVPAAVPAKPYELERLSDPDTAAAYLSVAAKDDDPAAFLQALRNVTEAMGGVARIAERTGLNRQQLYRTLSKEGNPELRSLTKILAASGVRLQFVAQRSMRRAGRRVKTGERRIA